MLYDGSLTLILWERDGELALTIPMAYVEAIEV